jgi:hypothetical protein
VLDFWFWVVVVGVVLAVILAATCQDAKRTHCITACEHRAIEEIYTNPQEKLSCVCSDPEGAIVKVVESP